MLNTNLAASRPHVLRVNPARPDPEALAEAAEAIRRGGLVGFPTETFYALGADAMNPAAVAKVFRAKGRAATDPIALVIADRAALDVLVQTVSPDAERLIARYWPGPLTLVFRASPGISEALTAGTGAIGIRIPAHPVALALLTRFGGPVTATSANRSGGPSPTGAGDVLAALREDLDGLLDAGLTPGGLSSTVVDVTGKRPRLIRAGAILFPASPSIR